MSRPRRPGALHRLGGAAAAHPIRVVLIWALAIVAVVALVAGFGGKTRDNYDVSGTESQAATEMLRTHFPDASGADARVVVHDRDGEPLDAVLLGEVRQRLLAMPSAGPVTEPRMSADGDTALFSVLYRVPVTAFDGSEGVDALKTAAEPARDAGLKVAYGGQVPENIAMPASTAEGIGVLAALVILVVGLGTVVAAGLPILVALVGVGLGFGAIMLLARTTEISTIAPTLGLMVGIGVGIDYALLLTTRHIEGLRRGLTPREAAAEATGTAGRAVLFAGFTVLASLMGLSLAGLQVYASGGIATGLIVACTLVAALTLVPALCALAGQRLVRRKHRGRPVVEAENTLTERWARRVTNRPIPWAVGAFVLLLVLTAPMLGMRLWPQDAGSQPSSSTTRQAYDLVDREFGEGANGPLFIAVDLTRTARADLPGLRDRLASVPGVGFVTEPSVSPAGDAAIITVEPRWGPQNEKATELVRHLRADVLPDGARITGVTAVFVDINDMLDERLWLVIAFVIVVSLLLLTVVFRSVVVPIKAALVNLLSVSAAYGVLVVVFQWGWGTSLLGLPHAVPVSSWLPILLFAVLFGLSMDYEVFLLSRIREEWLRTGDAKESVVTGLAKTGRVIGSAALIMIAVFTGFGLAPDVTLKMMGVGMATAVLIDATLVRLILVPATMTLLGKANWWLPAWMDRVLPRVDVHGHEDEPAPEPDAKPVPVG